MSKEKKKPMLVGVHRGGGMPPGYKWTIFLFPQLKDEAMQFLTGPQYRHVASQYQDLARQTDPAHPSLKIVDVRPIEDYFELRDKGGVLGKINFRGYFYLDKEKKRIVVLGADKKERENQTSQAIKERMQFRLRQYLTSHR